MKTLIQRVRTSPAAGNFALVTSATAIAQAGNFAWTPFLTRLYTPADFGVMSVFVSAVITVSMCASLCLEQAIVLEKEDSDAFGVFVACCALVATCSIGAGVAVLVLRLAVSPLLVAAGVAASGLGLPLVAWCTRRRAFRLTAASQILRVGTVIAAQAGGALLAAGATGLIAGYLSGELAAAGLLGWRVFRLERNQARVPTPGEAWQLVRRHRNFPLYSAPQWLLNMASQGLPAFVLAGCFGAHVAGAYWLAVRVLLAPCTLAGAAFRQVYYEYACRLNRSGISFYPAMRSATAVVSAIACVVVLAATALAPRVFVLIFGREWQLAGTYAAILAPWTAAMIANLPSVSVLPILGKQRFALGFDVIVFLGRVLALACGALLGSHIAAIAAYSGVGLALNAALILIVFEFARRHTAGGATVALHSAGVRYA